MGLFLYLSGVCVGESGSWLGLKVATGGWFGLGIDLGLDYSVLVLNWTLSWSGVRTC